MTTLYHFPCFHSLSSPKLSSSLHFPSPYSGLNLLHNFHCSTICASSVNKSPRASGKPKSDEELCNDIKDFLYSAGLPENHVPTMKELSLHGRQNLANIVRRRGYKFIKQLLETSSKTNFVSSDTYTSQTGNFEMLGQVEKQSGMFVEVLSDDSKEENTHSCIDEDDEIQMNYQSSVSIESLSLQEKAARFMQLGKLDETEGCASGIANDKKADEEGKKSRIEHSNEIEFAFSMLNGNVHSSALEVEDTAFETTTSRDNYTSTKEQANTSGEELNDEKVEKQTDIEHLRYLLHKKELELIQLKEEIEKEKLALSLLHSKAEEEINEAQGLVSEKETELVAAEETLSGLVEVDIQYSGEGETVELAGSFNGWHQNIPMDPKLTSSTEGSTESGTSQVWQVQLWLYPGVYEIKFVIDGHWTVDPGRESITRNGVHNNILHVDTEQTVEES